MKPTLNEVAESATSTQLNRPQSFVIADKQVQPIRRIVDQSICRPVHYFTCLIVDTSNSRIVAVSSDTVCPMTQATISQIPPDFAAALQSCGAWSPDCPIPLTRLCLISSIPYVDFSNVEHNDGELVVLDVVAPRVAQIFHELYQRRFPIAKIRSIHHYQGNDELSMSDNNTSCFCHRPIEGSDKASMHSYGLAIDVNPVQNPFITFEPGNEHNPIIQPKESWQYLNRHNQKPGMVEGIVTVFAEHGFIRWGGSWTTPIDFHHFEIADDQAQTLLRATSL
ncbi:MAG: M15 family metallopeptidase [Candidatus Obscuribacterales bacterium]|nr:M15 family metallopeptidase [Candidatus Obscuribacterales bacterium]